MTFLKTKDGFKIYYEFLKRDDNKPVLVFIHGWMMNWTCFKKEIEHFKRKGYSVLYLDLRGHGKSDKPELKKDYSLHKMQNDLFKIIKKEKIKEIILIGYSMGGMVAQLFTLEHNKLIKKLILLNSSYKRIFFGMQSFMSQKNRKVIQKKYPDFSDLENKRKELLEQLT